MEIVIENPVESPPPPPPPPPPPSPPPPPPLQPLTMSSWNAIVTAPSSTTTFSSSNAVACCTSMPAATAVMTITIAENPTATPSYPPPPVRFSYRETYAANSLPFAGDPYSVRRGQPRGRSYDDPDGASPTVRRIDKSGLLGITEPDVGSTIRTGLRSPRFLPGMNSVVSGMLSPRRFECIGQLDPVPEIPGQISRANASNAFPVASTIDVPPIGVPSMIGHEIRDGRRLDSCETLSGVVDLARPTKPVSFDSLGPRHRIDHTDAGTALPTFDRNLDGIEPANLDASGYASSFQLQENCEARGRTLARLSKFGLVRNEHDDTAAAGIGRYSETCCNFPFAVRTAATAFSGFEGTSSLPTTRVTTTTVTTSTATVAVSAMRETDANEKQEDVEGCNDRAPEEVRAEAEGCEHGSTRNLMKDGESSERTDEFADNDGIQTLRVIILSEQL